MSLITLILSKVSLAHDCTGLAEKCNSSHSASAPAAKSVTIKPVCCMVNVFMMQWLQGISN